MTDKTDRPKNVVPFYNWLEKAYPDIRLTPHQVDAVDAIFNDLIYNHGRGTGKSFIIRLIYEYDKATQHRGDLHD